MSRDETFYWRRLRCWFTGHYLPHPHDKECRWCGKLKVDMKELGPRRFQ